MARSKPQPARKARARDEDAPKELEVEDAAAAEPKAPLGIETALVFVTLVALLAAFVLIEMRAKSAFGSGLIF